VSDLLDKLLKAPTESEVLEFKEAKSQYDRDKLGKYFSALSNEANLKNQSHAWLLFGIDNKKNIVGTTISEARINEYKNEVSNHSTLNLTFSNVHRFKRPEGDVLALEIPAAPAGIPVSWKGHYYGRDGESLGALNWIEIDKIKNQSNQIDWSAEIIENASLDDLLPSAIDEARVQFMEKNPKLTDQIKQWNDITFLNKAKITIRGKITRTAVLLLGKPESEHLINPAVAKITWILKDKDNIEKDYEHFSCPFLLNVEEVYRKVRNIKYRYIVDSSLFPEETDTYDPFIIREALNNCIAHQDYTLGGKINVVEREDSLLTFVNSGDFIPQSVEEVIMADAPETKYRNQFLVTAMVNLNMIDTTGSGIKRMFRIQKDKLFPLPDYDFSDRKVKVTITGKVIDMAYAKKLVQVPDLSLEEIMLLDKIAKKKQISKDEAKQLKIKKLIEGRYPNNFISATVAKVTDEKGDYIKMRGFHDDHYKKMILEFIDKYKSASKADIDNLLIDILPSVLDKKKKENKIRNIVYAMSKKDLTITNTGTTRKPKWVRSSSK